MTGPGPDIAAVSTLTLTGAQRVLGASLAAGELGATHDWFDLIKDEPALLRGIVKTERLIVFAGGVAVRSGGALVGAAGVSGGSAELDRAIAEVGANALDLGV